MSAAALAAYAGASTGAQPYVLLADRDDGTVVRCGDTVAKAHAPDSDPDALAVRIRIAGDGALAGVLLPPLRTGLGLVGGRAVSLWPYGAPVAPDRPEDAPWEAVAELLAALHRTPLHVLPAPVPPMRGPAKLARALHRLAAAHPPAPGAPAHAPLAGGPAAVQAPAGGAPGSGSGSGAHPDPGAGCDRQADPDDASALARLVRAAARTLPGWARGEGPQPPGGALCHGDLHLGQLVRGPAGHWRLIDVDDLGLGTPAWDLARPAAWYAAGLLDTETWLRFLDAYRSAGGPAAGPPGSDPWPELDLAARALTVQTAALALAKADRERRRLDGVERLMVDACVRIASLPTDLERRAPS
ncbi:phosphotransferase [Streptomyces sp. NBC_00435]|uniref:phosphotransferase family protein n=1 Tax=Streptomyces sp. NBC_00435 TaxID=2903649 RepID=UPI002E1EFCEA